MLIGKDWKIESDALNIMLFHKNRKGNWGNAFGYYSNIKEALHALVDQGVRETALASLEELQAGIDRLHALIDKAVIR